MPNIKSTGYADDRIFLIQGISLDIHIELAQPAINLEVQWFGVPSKENSGYPLYIGRTSLR